MWSNIGNVAEHRESVNLLPSPRRSIDSGTGKPHHDAMYVYADCHSAVKGIFMGTSDIIFQKHKNHNTYFKPLSGLLILVVGMIGVIVYMSLSNSYCDNIVENKLSKCEGALWANDSIESIILIIMIASSAWVYYCITQLDVNPSPISLLDDMLLFLCIPFFILYCALNLVSAAMFDPEVHAKGYLVPEIDSTIMTNVLMVSETSMNMFDQDFILKFLANPSCYSNSDDR